MKTSTRTILLVLLDGEELHGLDIVRRSDGVLRRGLIYVHLSRLERAWLVSSRVDPAEADREPQRRLYQITVRGIDAIERQGVADVWLRRLVAVRGSIIGDRHMREVTYDLVHVRACQGHRSARIVSRRTELDGEIVEWIAYDEPIRVELRKGEIAQVERAIASEAVACA